MIKFNFLFYIFLKLFENIINIIIKMDEITDDIEVSDEIKVHPPHFFSFLINLVKCAS